MQIAKRQAWGTISSKWAKTRQIKGQAFLIELVDAVLVVLREYLKDVDKLGRRVWRTQGQKVEPEFVRGVLNENLSIAIDAFFSAIKGEIGRLVCRTNVQGSSAALSHLAHSIRRLKGEINARCAIQARELEHQINRKILRSKSPRSGREEPGVPLPSTWEELRKRGSINRSQAASYLKRGTKTVLRLVQARELRESTKKRIVCNEMLRKQIRKVHGQHVLP
jgi:hypothetical protein